MRLATGSIVRTTVLSLDASFCRKKEHSEAKLTGGMWFARPLTYDSLHAPLQLTMDDRKCLHDSRFAP